MTSRLARLAGLLRMLVWLGIGLLALLPSLTWLDPELAHGLLRRGGRLLDLTPRQRWIGWAVTMPPFLIVMAGFGQILAFCGRLREGRVFSVAAALALRRLGWSLILASLALPVSRVALALLLDGGTPNLSILAVACGATVGLMFVVFAAILAEAADLAKENQSFI